MISDMLPSICALTAVNYFLLLMIGPVVHRVIFHWDPEASRWKRFWGTARTYSIATLFAVPSAIVLLLILHGMLAPKFPALFDWAQLAAFCLVIVAGFASNIRRQSFDLSCSVKAKRATWVEWFGTDSDAVMAMTIRRALRYKLYLTPLSMAITEVALVSLVKIAPPGNPTIPGSPPPSPLEGEWLAVLVAVIATRVLLSAIVFLSDPSGSALRNFLMPFVGTEVDNPRGAKPRERTDGHPYFDRDLGVTMSRWRGREHVSAFRGTRALMRSVVGLKRKIPETEHEFVRRICSRVSYLVVRESIDMSPGVHNSKYNELCLAGISIFAKTNLIEACRVVDEFTVEFVVPEVEQAENKRAMMRVFESIDGFMQRNSRVLMLILGATIICVYIVSAGSITVALERLLPSFPK